MTNIMQPKPKAKGTIILDEIHQKLECYLNKNIHIRIPPKGMSVEEISHDWLTNRIFITGNSKIFVPFAPIYDIGIVATEGVKKEGRELANIIDNAIEQYNLWERRHGYILRLQEDGNHILDVLID